MTPPSNSNSPPDKASAPAPRSQPTPSAVAAPFKPLSTSNRPSTARPTDLPSKVAQLKNTIAHTQQQLIETLDKLSALPSIQKPTQHQKHAQITSTATDTVTNPTTTTSLNTDRPRPTSPSNPTLPHLHPSLSVLSQPHQTSLASVQGTLTNHINLLKQYNEVKDAGMMMLGIIAEKEGRLVKDVMRRRGVVDD